MSVKPNKRKPKVITGEPPKEVKFKEPIVEPPVVVEETKELESVKIKKTRPKTRCSCGIEISNSGMARHLTGKKHRESMEE